MAKKGVIKNLVIIFVSPSTMKYRKDDLFPLRYMTGKMPLPTANHCCKTFGGPDDSTTTTVNQKRDAKSNS